MGGTVSEAWAAAVAAHGDRIALAVDGTTLTYAELDAASARQATALAADGDADTHPLAIDATNERDTVVQLLAALRAGRVALMLDPRDPPGYRDELRAFVSGPVPGDAAIVSLTAGTTGTPKAVIHTHADLLHQARERAAVTPVQPGDRFMVPHPLAFGASAVSLFAALFSGATACLYDVGARGGDGLPAWIRDQSITTGALVPTLARVLVAAAPAPMPEVRGLWLDGESIHASDLVGLLRVFPNARLLPMYGANETGVVAFGVIEPGTPLTSGFVPMRAAPTQRITIDDDGFDAAPGELGRIVVTGPSVALGYWGEAPFPEYDGGRSVDTGDLGRLHDDGFLEVLGRADDRVKVRGQAVHPAVVERALVEIPGVREAVVTPVPDVRGGARLVAHVVPDPEVAVAVRDLRTGLTYRLPPHAVPSRFRLLDALPLTDRHAVDRPALEAAAAAGLDEADYVAPRDDVEARVASMVAEILGVERVGIAHDLYDTGADSLAVVELINALEDEFDCDVSQLLVDANEQPIATVAAIAEFLRAGQTVVPATQLLVQLTGREATEGPPVFLLPGIGGDPIVMRDVARRLAPRRVYSFFPHGYLHRALPDQSLAAIARRYVAALTEREPDGPIVLGGFSFGAYVAYEMARQLRAAGRVVPLLVIFDTSFGDADDGAEVRLEHYAQRLRDTATDHESGPGLARLRRVGRMLVDSAAFRIDRAFLVSTAGVLRRSYSEQGRAFVAHHVRVLRRYRAKGYGGRMLVVVGESRSRGAREADLGWRGLVTGPVESVAAHGNHATLLRAPQVDAVARAVTAAIDRVVDDAP